MTWDRVKRIETIKKLLKGLEEKPSIDINTLKKENTFNKAVERSLFSKKENKNRFF